MKFSLVGAIGIWSVVLAWPSDSVQIIFCDSGQGDETLIQRGFYQILIDGSRPGRALDCLSKHMPFFDRTIDMVVVTHPQLDHFGGVSDVLDRYKLIRYVYNGYGSDSPEWMQLSKKLLSKKVPISIVSAGDEIRMSDVVFRVLWPPSGENGDSSSTFLHAHGRPEGAALRRQHARMPEKQTSDSPIAPSVLGIKSSRDPNMDAIVLMMKYGNFNALFTADIGEGEEAQLQGLEHTQALKVAHHGSKTSSSESFLNVVHPRLAVIEVGKNNYGHPNKETIDRLKAIGARVLRTDQDGDVVVETDGTHWHVK